MNGVLNIYKPQNMTSHDVVAIVRGALQTKKVGHTGTLDPMATGVLPICVGRATKIVDLLQSDKKTYACELTLGQTTDTEDCWGTVLESQPVDLKRQEIEAAVMSFVGDIYQTPPMYSALKVKGKKLYELARQGKVIEREKRLRTIYSIEDLEIQGHKARFLVKCSKGTYIRTLCADIGEKLGVGGHMSALERVETGSFSKDDAISVDQVKHLGLALADHLLPIDEALACDLKIDISTKACELIKNGVKIDLLHYLKVASQPGDYVLVYHDQKFIALSQHNGEKLIVKTLFDITRSS